MKPQGKHWLSKVNIYCIWGCYFKMPGTAGPWLDPSHCLKTVSVLFSSTLELSHTHTHIASIYLLLTNADHNERLSLRDHSQQGQYQSSKVWLPELVFSIFHPIALHAIRLLSVIIGSGHKNPWWQIWLHNQIAAEWIQSASKLSMQTWNLLPGDCGTREVFPIRQRDFCQGIYPS